jgi:D-alanyl-D-alanine carboxypeptidase
VSAIRYWPLPVFVALTALVLLVCAAGWAIARSRGGTPLPGIAVAGAMVALASLIGASLYAIRPGFLSAPPAAESAAASPFSLRAAEAHLASLVAAEAPPGLTAIVVKDGRVVYAEGFGVADGPRGVRSTPETVYRWWSITKVFTAVAVMQLAENGRLGLDDPVGKFVPGFSPLLDGQPARPITIRDLLSHSSGLPDAGNEILGWIHFEDDPALEQTALLEAVLPAYSHLASAPGTEGRYSNIGYMVLSAVIESASGEKFEDYITSHILEPLGMMHTDFEYPAVAADQIAVGSHPVDVMVVPASLAIDLDLAVRERAKGRLWFERVYPDQTGPSGLVGPASDMARFMAAMLAGGELEGVRILSEESVNAMGSHVIAVRFSPAPGKGYGFGLAWFLRNDAGRPSWSHGGQGMGMSSLISLFPEEGLGVLVVGNSTYLGRDFGASAVATLAAVDWDDAMDQDNAAVDPD